MNLKLSFIIQTSQKMQTVVHFRYRHVVKWQVCVSFVCFDSKLCYSFAFLSISYYYLSAYLPICIYLKEKWRRSYWMLKSSWPRGSKVILPRNSAEFCLEEKHACDWSVRCNFVNGNKHHAPIFRYKVDFLKTMLHSNRKWFAWTITNNSTHNRWFCNQQPNWLCSVLIVRKIAFQLLIWQNFTHWKWNIHHLCFK